MGLKPYLPRPWSSGEMSRLLELRRPPRLTGGLLVRDVALRKSEKERRVSELRQMVVSATGLVLLTSTGVGGQQMASLRGRLREGGHSVKVVRNTLFRRALDGTWAQPLVSEVAGPVTVLACGEDLVAGAKTAIGLEANAPGMRVKAALLGDKVRTRSGVLDIANLPAKEMLLGQLIYLLRDPVSRLIQTLEQPARNLVFTIQAASQRRPES